MGDFDANFVLQNDSMSGDEEVPDHEHEVTFDVPLMLFRLLVCTIGTAGNLLVIFVILALREYEKAATHWYVLQLAIADSLFLLTLPFKIVEDIHDEWIYSDAMCRLKEGILFLNYYSSIIFLTVMSIDRYIAVCHGFAKGLQRLRTKLAAYMIAGAVWLVCLLLCTPVFAYSNKMGMHPRCKCQYEFPSSKQSPEEHCEISTAELPQKQKEAEYLKCVESEKKLASQGSCLEIDFAGYSNYSGGDTDYSGGDTDYDETTSLTDVIDSPEDIFEHGCTYAANGPGWKAFLSFNFVGMFAIPFIVMSVCYTLILMRLAKTRLRSDSVPGNASTSDGGSVGGNRTRQRLKSAASKRAEKNRNRVTIMCGALVVLFLICWLPFHTIHLAKMNGISGSSEFCLKLSSVASLVAYVNSALNPYLYNFIGTKFWKRLRSATGSVRRSVRNRASSLSGSVGTVRYQPRKHKESGTSSTGNTGTMVVKIHQGKHQNGSHPGSSCEEVGERDENQPMVEIKNSAETAEKD